MLDLSTRGLTLLCATSVYIPESVRAFNRCAELCRFTDAVFLTHEIPADPVSGRVLIIPTMRSVAAYSDFMLSRVCRYVDTKHFLTVQWDGFIVNPEAWSDDFLEYDYIGAPWDTGEVGNSGFSIRSKELAKITSLLTDRPDGAADDVWTCRTRRNTIEKMYGMRFAPESLAHRFAWEQNARHPAYSGQFGIHLPQHNRSAAEIDRWLTATQRKES